MQNMIFRKLKRILKNLTKLPCTIERYWLTLITLAAADPESERFSSLIAVIGVWGTAPGVGPEPRCKVPIAGDRGCWDLYVGGNVG